MRLWCQQWKCWDLYSDPKSKTEKQLTVVIAFWKKKKNSVETMSCLLYYVAERNLFFQPRIHPSLSCGPFRFFPNMWLIVPTTFHSLSDTAREFLFFIGSQAFSIPLFILSWWNVFSINTLMCFFLLSCCFIIIVFLPVSAWCCVIS